MRAPHIRNHKYLMVYIAEDGRPVLTNYGTFIGNMEALLQCSDVRFVELFNANNQLECFYLIKSHPKQRRLVPRPRV